MKHNFLILSLSVMTFISCSKQQEQASDAPKPLDVVEVAQQNITGYSEFPVNIQGIVNNDVRAKIQGYITQVLVDEGQYVLAGQPLFRLETNMLNENADAARSGIGAAKANVQAARAAVQAAEVEVNKLKPLVAKNIISDVQLQTAQANLTKAIAQLAQANAAQSQANASYKSVQANIDYSIIRAPISGVVGSLPLRVGSLVGPSDATPLTTISDTKSIYAYFSMNEKDYLSFLKDIPGATVPEKLRNIPMVELVLANGEVYSEKGKVEAVTGQINPNTGSIQFRASFTNPAKLLANGSSGRIRIPKAYDNVLVIPEVSTYEQQGLVNTYIVEKDTLRPIVVDVVSRVNNKIIIKSGLKKGDVVVATATGGLKKGTKIKPQPVHIDSVTNAIKPVF